MRPAQPGTRPDRLTDNSAGQPDAASMSRGPIGKADLRVTRLTDLSPPTPRRFGQSPGDRPLPPPAHCAGHSEPSAVGRSSSGPRTLATAVGASTRSGAQHPRRVLRARWPAERPSLSVLLLAFFVGSDVRAGIEAGGNLSRQWVGPFDRQVRCCRLVVAAAQ